MTRTTLHASIALAAAAVALTSGCTVLGQAREACVDWVPFETPAAAAEGHLVVRGTVVGRAGTQRVYGVRAQRWELDVAEVLAGEGARAGERITVVSTPVTCTGDGELYPGGDLLDTDATVIAILADVPADRETGERGRLQTVTPSAGVVMPGPDGGLPERWPQGHPSA